MTLMNVRGGVASPRPMLHLPSAALRSGTGNEHPSTGGQRGVTVIVLSNPLEFKAELADLHHKAFQDLRKYGNDSGVNVEVIDVAFCAGEHRDPAVEAVLASQVARCVESQVPLAFLVLAGMRTGPPHIPLVLSSDKYTRLAKELDDSDMLVLRACYDKDDNSPEKHYVLKEGSAAKKEQSSKRHEDRWGKLAAIMERAKLAQQSTITSWLEKLGIANGLKGNTALVVHRTIHGVLDAADDNIKQRFVQSLDATVAAEAASTMQALVEKAQQSIGDAPVHSFDVDWAPGVGVDAKSAKHREYLRSLNGVVVEAIKNRIDQVAEPADAQDPILRDMNTHALLAGSYINKHAMDSTGKAQIMDVFSDPKKSSNVIVLTGCGKSSTLSLLAADIKQSHPESVLLMRFCGRSPYTSSSYLLLLSLCKQVLMVSGGGGLDELDTLAPHQLPSALRDALEDISEQGQAGAHLLLDDIDAVITSPRLLTLWRDALAMLARVCNVVVSVSTTFSHVDDLAPNATAVNIGPLSRAAADRVVEETLKASNRTLTKTQKKAVSNALNVSTSPAFVRLVAATALSWRSSMQGADLSVFSSKKQLITHTLKSIEGALGKNVAAACCVYLVHSRFGLSVTELANVLSLDDNALSAASLSDMPAGILCFPHATLMLFIEKAKEILSTAVVNGSTLLFIADSEVKAVICSRYLGAFSPSLSMSMSTSVRATASPNPSSDGISATASASLRILRDYWTGRWAGLSKAFKDPASGAKDPRNRLVPTMPHTFAGEGSRGNLRMLLELPHVLQSAKDMDNVDAAIAFDFAFLDAMVSGLSVYSAIDSIPIGPGSDTVTFARRCVSEALVLAAPILQKAPRQLSQQLLMRLEAVSHANVDIKRFLEQVSNAFTADDVERCFSTSPAQVDPSHSPAVVCEALVSYEAFEAHNDVIAVLARVPRLLKVTVSDDVVDDGDMGAQGSLAKATTAANIPVKHKAKGTRVACHVEDVSLAKASTDPFLSCETINDVCVLGDRAYFLSDDECRAYSVADGALVTTIKVGGAIVCACQHHVAVLDGLTAHIIDAASGKKSKPIATFTAPEPLTDFWFDGKRALGTTGADAIIIWEDDKAQPVHIDLTTDQPCVPISATAVLTLVSGDSGMRLALISTEHSGSDDSDERFDNAADDADREDDAESSAGNSHRVFTTLSATAFDADEYLLTVSPCNKRAAIVSASQVLWFALGNGADDAGKATLVCEGKYWLPASFSHPAFASVSSQGDVFIAYEEGQTIVTRLRLCENEALADISSVAVSRDERSAVCATRNAILLYDLSSGLLLTATPRRVAAEELRASLSRVQDVQNDHVVFIDGTKWIIAETSSLTIVSEAAPGATSYPLVSVCANRAHVYCATTAGTISVWSSADGVLLAESDPSQIANFAPFHTFTLLPQQNETVYGIMPVSGGVVVTVDFAAANKSIQINTDTSIDGVTTLADSARGVVVGCGNQLISLSDKEPFTGHTKAVTVVAASRERLISAAHGEVIAWDVGTRSALKVLALDEAVVAVSLSDATDHVAISTESTLEIWDSKLGHLFCRFRSENPITHCEAFSTTATSVVLACTNGKVARFPLSHSKKAKVQMRGISMFGAMGVPNASDLLNTRNKLKSAKLTPPPSSSLSPLAKQALPAHLREKTLEELEGPEWVIHEDDDDDDDDDDNNGTKKKKDREERVVKPSDIRNKRNSKRNAVESEAREGEAASEAKAASNTDADADAAKSGGCCCIIQ